MTKCDETEESCLMKTNERFKAEWIPPTKGQCCGSCEVKPSN